MFHRRLRKGQRVKKRATRIVARAERVAGTKAAGAKAAGAGEEVDHMIWFHAVLLGIIL